MNLRPSDVQNSAPPLVEAVRLSKEYVRRRGFRRLGAPVRALREVNLAIPRGKTVALVGESGSGKSTLARCLALLEPPSSGEIRFDGKNVSTANAKELGAYRHRIQLVFQDAASALNPAFTLQEIVEEPLLVQGIGDAASRREVALAALEEVGLMRTWAMRRPLQLSGGQRQRLAPARALVLKPEFLILDEALSGLDLSVQAQIVNLLLELQAAHGLTYLYISHDLALATHLADQIAVLSSGEIIERGTAADVLRAPREEHTRALVASMLRLDAVR